MSLKDRIKGFMNSAESEKAKTFSEASIDDPILRAMLSRKQVTREQCLNIPKVAANVDFVTSTFAILPVKLYKKHVKDGYKTVEEVVGDYRISLLNGDNGSGMNGFQLKKALCEDYLLSKGGYAYLKKRGNKIVSVNYVESNYVWPLKINADPLIREYVILCNGKRYYPFEWIRFLRNTKDGMRGVGLIEQINDALNTAYSMMMFQLNMMKKGGNKKGFLQSETSLTQPMMNALRKAWTSLYSDASTSDNVVVLNKGVTFKESSNTAVEMQLVESIRSLNDEIDEIFHIDQDYNTFVKKAILPLCTAFISSINSTMLLEREKKASKNGKYEYFFDFDYREIEKASMKERFDAYKSAMEAGWISGNEVREKENMNRAEGLDSVNIGLGSVMLNIKTGEIYTPNTDTTHKGGEW